MPVGGPRRITLAVAALLALLAAAPVTAGAAPGMEIALQDDGVLVKQQYYDRGRALAQIRDLGVTRLRMNLTWTAVLGSQAKKRHMPHRLRYDWSRYDAAVDAARAYGFKVHLTLTGPAPRWATGNHKVGVNRPNA